MKFTKRTLSIILILSLILCTMQTQEVSAAKVTTTKYTISKKAGTYSGTIKVKITAKKGYKVYYTTGSSFSVKKVIKSTKSKTITIKKTTTLKIYAVKSSKTITKKTLKTSKVKKAAKSYKYTIKAVETTSTESTTNTTNSTTTTNTTNSTTTTDSASSTQQTVPSDIGQNMPTPPAGGFPGQQDTSATDTAVTSDTAKSDIDQTLSDASTKINEALTNKASSQSVITNKNIDLLDIINDGQETVIKDPDDNNKELAVFTPASSEKEASTLTLKGSGINYIISSDTDATIKNLEIVVTADSKITLNNITIDNSDLTSNNSVILFNKCNGEISFEGNNSIIGPSAFDNTVNEGEPAAIIASDNKSKSLLISGSGSLTVTDSMSESTDYTGLDENGAVVEVDPADGISAKGALEISDGTITVNTNGDALKGTNTGVTITGGNNKLTSKLGKGITSKNGIITISGGTTSVEYSADDAVSAKNNTAIITGGSFTAENCYGDGIQAENIYITGGNIDIKTNYEYANTNFYKTNSVSGSKINSETENESTGLKTETINYDTGSHKALKAGTKDKTETYTSTGETVTTTASGGIIITGGTINLDTTATGIKYNGGSSGGQGGNSKTIIGSPDDAIHSNNTTVISGGDITINSSDDGISSVNSLYILDSADITINTSYEGIESGIINIGKSDNSASEPSVSVKSNDDGINAAKKSDLKYIYEDVTEAVYIKTSVKTSGNTLTVTAGNLIVEIDDSSKKQVKLANKGESATTYSFSADGDGIDCNGSFYALGGNITVYGGTSNGNGVIDRDDSFVIGEGVTLFAIGTSGMIEGVTLANQPYISSTITINSGNTLKINNSSGNTLYSYTSNKNYNYVLYSSPQITNNESYIVNAGSNSETVTATTNAQNNGMSGNPGGQGGIPGQQPPTGGFGG